MAVRVLRFTQTPTLRRSLLLQLRRSRTDFLETADPFRRTALSISYSRQRSHGTQKSTFVKALETCRAILIQVFGSCLIQSRSPIYLGFRLNEPDPCGAVEIALCFCPYLYRHKTPSCPPGHGHSRSEKLARHSRATSAVPEVKEFDVSGLSCRWWKFATRELYGMKFMQSNIKSGRDLSNLRIGIVQGG